MKKYIGLREAAIHLSVNVGVGFSESDVVELASQGEVRCCFYFDGRLAFYPDAAPWDWPTEREHLHDFRGYLEIPAPVVSRINDSEWIEIFGVRRAVQSLHAVDGTASPPTEIMQGVKPPAFFCRPKPRIKKGDEIPPDSFTLLGEKVLIPTVDLTDYLNRLAPEGPRKANDSVDAQSLAPRERTTLLNIIGALVELIQTPKSGRGSQAAVISELLANYSDKQGISRSTLEQKFAEAKRSLFQSP